MMNDKRAPLTHIMALFIAPSDVLTVSGFTRQYTAPNYAMIFFVKSQKVLYLVGSRIGRNFMYIIITFGFAYGFFNVHELVHVKRSCKNSSSNNPNKSKLV